MTCFIFDAVNYPSPRPCTSCSVVSKQTQVGEWVVGEYSLGFLITNVINIISSFKGSPMALVTGDIFGVGL